MVGPRHQLKRRKSRAAASEFGKNSVPLTDPIQKNLDNFRKSIRYAARRSATNLRPELARSAFQDGRDPVLRIFPRLLLALMSWLAVCGPTLANDYPNRTIRIVLGLAAGGGGDAFARVLSEELRKSLGVPVVVENRPGGNETIGARVCADAEPGMATPSAYCPASQPRITSFSTKITNSTGPRSWTRLSRFS